MTNMNPSDDNVGFFERCSAWFRDGFSRVKPDAGVLGFIILIIIAIALFSCARDVYPLQEIDSTASLGFSIAGGLTLVAAAIALQRKD